MPVRCGYHWESWPSIETMHVVLVYSDLMTAMVCSGMWKRSSPARYGFPTWESEALEHPEPLRWLLLLGTHLLLGFRPIYGLAELGACGLEDRRRPAGLLHAWEAEHCSLS